MAATLCARSRDVHCANQRGYVHLYTSSEQGTAKHNQFQRVAELPSIFKCCWVSDLSQDSRAQQCLQRGAKACLCAHAPVGRGADASWPFDAGHQRWRRGVKVVAGFVRRIAFGQRAHYLPVQYQEPVVSITRSVGHPRCQGHGVPMLVQMQVLLQIMQCKKGTRADAANSECRRAPSRPRLHMPTPLANPLPAANDYHKHAC